MQVRLHACFCVQFQREDFFLFHNKTVFIDEATWSPWIALQKSDVTVQVTGCSRLNMFLHAAPCTDTSLLLDSQQVA